MVKNDFEKTLLEIKTIIDNNSKNVDSNTSINQSGIYMIYIDNFLNPSILPIYIGKSENIQKRYEQHYKEILSLNHLSYETYYDYFFCRNRNFYDGSFKTTKIFKFMIENGCNLKDYKMIALEFCDKTCLEEREQYYIQKFKAEYFGFNQLNTRTLSPLYIDAIKKKNFEYIDYYYKQVLNNIINIQRYYNYGYTSFNYDYVFHRINEFKDDSANIELLKEVNKEYLKLKNKVPFKKEYSLLEESKEKLKDILYEIKTLESSKKSNCFDYQDSSELLDKMYALMKPRRLYAGNHSDFIKGIENESNRKRFEEYLIKKKIEINPYDALSIEISEFVKKRKSISDYNLNIDKKIMQLKTIIKQARNENIPLKEQIFSDIFPKIKFQAFVLKDNLLKQEYVYDNNCNIYITLSNNARNKIPNIISIVYTNKNTLYQHFIKSILTDNIEEIKYVEKNVDKPIQFMGRPPKPFEVIPANISNYISTAVEYNTGINDYTLKNCILEDFNIIIDKLYKIMQLGIKITLKTNTSKNVLKMALTEYDSEKYNQIFKI